MDKVSPATPDSPNDTASLAGSSETLPAAPATEPLLEVDAVTLRFGGVTALSDVSLTLNEGEILGLIGPNGAGKTSLFNVITGVFKPTAGEVRFRGIRVSGRPKYKVTRLGIARTFQNIRLFPEMTALENVMVGTDARHKTSVPGVLFPFLRTPRRAGELTTLSSSSAAGRLWQVGKRFVQRVTGVSRNEREEIAATKVARELLSFVGISGRAEEAARNLSYGDQRRLEIARALATEPKLLCLDEPAAGFNPAEKQKLLDLIRKIRDRGVTVLLIEHDMRLVMGVTDRIIVLDFGRKIAEGSPAEVRNNPDVIAAYLGVPADA